MTWSSRIVADSSNRPAWLEARKPFVCGSEVAAMLSEGYGDFGRRELVMLKAGLAEPWQGDESTETGQDLEDSGFYQLRARRKWGWQLEHFGKLVRDPVCPVLAATPDFLLRTPWGLAVVQAKGSTTQAKEDTKPQKNGDPSTAAYANGAPIRYQLQIQTELAVMELEWGALLTLHAAGGKWKLRAYPVRRNDAAIAVIRREAVRLMQDVERLRAVGAVT